EPDYWYAFAGNPSEWPTGGTYTGPPIDRIAGADRYATAAAISHASFPRDVPVAYIATGLGFADALAAGAAAAAQGGPVLLVRRTILPSATANELAWLRPAVIKVAGGTAVISDEIVAALASYATTGQVERLAGANRYGTAAVVSLDTFAAGVPVAYVATGMNFPDALAGVAAAGAEGGPVLLVRPDEIPSETVTELARLNPGRIVVLGGPSVVSDAVAAALAAHASSGTVERLSGANRYATAVAVSAAKFADPSTVFIATGQTFPDALGGGPVAGRLPGPLLLVSSTSVPSVVATELQSLDPDRVVILGGPGAVSDSVIYQLMSILGD
ncbi:MAG TPA: cell wall-binding repeat-containing protein, partial [Methylomirabilota bacterium]|nr:cell wall-binding repeat-containing protein [Methylomirabilota bacterium]